MKTLQQVVCLTPNSLGVSVIPHAGGVGVTPGTLGVAKHEDDLQDSHGLLACQGWAIGQLGGDCY